VLTGDAMVRTGLGEKLLNFAEATFGSLRSGFGTSTVMGCGLFACISGSDAADAAAVGRLTMDRLVERGYPKPYACALVASGACTGILIPPSIAYIIIGLVLGVSSSTLFLAAFVPGVMVLLSVMVTNAVINRVRGYETSGPLQLRPLAARRLGGALRAVDPADHPRRHLLRRVHAHRIGRGGGGGGRGHRAGAEAPDAGRLPGDAGHLGPRVRRGAADHRGGAAVLAGADGADVPQAFVAWVMGFGTDRTAVILLFLAIWIVAGMFMETGPNIVVFGPLLWPLANAVGMNQIHFCVFMITTLGWVSSPRPSA
jgi:C4-dicarboxylate transporter DctM subunit